MPALLPILAFALAQSAPPDQPAAAPAASVSAPSAALLPDPAPAVMVGLQMAPLDPALAGHFGLAPSAAIMISGVAKGLPADAAGLRPYDIILSIDDAPARTTDQLRATLAPRHPGDHVTLHIVHAGQSKDVPLTLVPYNPATFASAQWDFILPSNTEMFSRNVFASDPAAINRAVRENLPPIDDAEAIELIKRYAAGQDQRFALGTLRPAQAEPEKPDTARDAQAAAKALAVARSESAASAGGTESESADGRAAAPAPPAPPAPLGPSSPAAVTPPIADAAPVPLAAPATPSIAPAGPAPGAAAMKSASGRLGGGGNAGAGGKVDANGGISAGATASLQGRAMRQAPPNPGYKDAPAASPAPTPAQDNDKAALDANFAARNLPLGAYVILQDQPPSVEERLSRLEAQLNRIEALLKALAPPTPASAPAQPAPSPK